MTTIEDAIKQTHFESELLKVNINLLFTANWLYNKITAVLKPFNITHEQFNVLRILKGSHPKSMYQKDILSRMIAPSSNLTLIIKKLVSKNLVSVQQSEKDGRAYQINITDAGLKLLTAIDVVIRNNDNYMHGLDTAEASQLNALLEKFRQV